MQFKKGPFNLWVEELLLSQLLPHLEDSFSNAAQNFFYSFFFFMGTDAAETLMEEVGWCLWSNKVNQALGDPKNNILESGEVLRHFPRFLQHKLGTGFVV